MKRFVTLPIVVGCCLLLSACQESTPHQVFAVSEEGFVNNSKPPFENGMPYCLSVRVSALKTLTMCQTIYGWRRVWSEEENKTNLNSGVQPKIKGTA